VCGVVSVCMDRYRPAAGRRQSTKNTLMLWFIIVLCCILCLNITNEYGLLCVFGEEGRGGVGNKRGSSIERYINRYSFRVGFILVYISLSLSLSLSIFVCVWVLE